MIESSSRNEISLKDIFLRLGELARYLIRKWYVVLICGILGAGIGLILSLVKKTKYIGELTFVLEESNKAGGLGAYSGLASQFGIDLGAMSGSSGLFTGDNLIEFLKSRLMVEKTLLTPVDVKGKQVTLADFYIDFNEIRPLWEKNSQLATLHYPVNQDRGTYTLQQDSVLNEMYKAIVKSNLIVVKPDKKLSFISVKCVSLNEQFSKLFTERLVKEATTFYVETKTKRSKSNVDKLQQKADSIERLLNQKTYSAAVSQDLNMNPVRNVANVKTELYARDKVVLQTMYGEVVKNLELSKISMSQETPLIQVVDTPIYPLDRQRLGKAKGIIFGGFIAGFLAITFLLLGKIFRSIMEDGENPAPGHS